MTVLSNRFVNICATQYYNGPFHMNDNKMNISAFSVQSVRSVFLYFTRSQPNPFDVQ